MLAAEELVLLSLGGHGGPARSGASTQVVNLGVVGALLGELWALERVTCVHGRLQVLGPPVGHPLLDRALYAAGLHDGEKLHRKVPAIARLIGRADVVDGLIAQGVLGRVKANIFTATRHPILDAERHQALRDRMCWAAMGTEPLPPLVAVVLAMAGPCRLLEVVAPDRSQHGRAKARIAEATALVPVAAPVRKAIEAAIAAQSSAATASVMVT